MDLQILSDAEIPLCNAINQLLQPLIGPFWATTARIVGNNGHTTAMPFCAIHCDESGAAVVPVDKVAAVIDFHDTLTVETLEAAYQHIKTVKSIRKTDRHDPAGGEIYMTTGIIVTRTSHLTLEELSSEIDRLNAQMPSHHWADAVAVLSTGLVSYSAQIPTSKQSGDFFLPAEAIVAHSPAPSIWVKKTIWPAGGLTFNKVASLIVARIAIFQPGVKVHDYRDLIKDMPSHGLVTQTYQFSLSKVLVAMTKEQVIATQLPTDTFNVVSGKKTLGSVQYQSWQDGGVFVVRGKFPIEMFLIFLNQIAPGLSAKDMQYFRGEDVQVSFVLPVTQQQFHQTLALFAQRSSNLSIHKEQSRILVQKIGDEGTSSPFVARLMMGIMGIRDAVYDETGRNHFDELYDPILSGLRDLREASQEIANLWEEHRAKVASGAILKISGRSVHVSEHIDRALKRDLENFLNIAVRTIKHSLQVLARDLGTEIGFLFQKQAIFEAGIAKTVTSDAPLADYLVATRQWSEPLVLSRNNLEHGTIPSPRVSYVLNSDPVRAEEPQFDGKPIGRLTNDVQDRACCFAEELIVHCLRKKLPRGFDITEVALADRDPNAPERFNVRVMPYGRSPWILTAHTKKFNEA